MERLDRKAEPHADAAGLPTRSAIGDHALPRCTVQKFGLDAVRLDDLDLRRVRNTGTGSQQGIPASGKRTVVKRPGVKSPTSDRIPRHLRASRELKKFDPFAHAVRVAVDGTRRRVGRVDRRADLDAHDGELRLVALRLPRPRVGERRRDRHVALRAARLHSAALERGGVGLAGGEGPAGRQGERSRAAFGRELPDVPGRQRERPPVRAAVHPDREHGPRRAALRPRAGGRLVAVLEDDRLRRERDGDAARGRNVRRAVGAEGAADGRRTHAAIIAQRDGWQSGGARLSRPLAAGGHGRVVKSPLKGRRPT